MTLSLATDPPRPDRRFLDTDQAAGYLGLSPRTLEKHRVYGGGPLFRKFGRRVFYAREDLDAWADARVYAHTSATGAAV
jgi:hypothetical protein